MANPVVLGMPSMVTCTGAGLRAKTSKRLLAVCRDRSTRMSMPVGADPVRHLRIAQAHNAVPVIGKCLEFLGDFIGTRTSE